MVDTDKRAETRPGRTGVLLWHGVAIAGLVVYAVLMINIGMSIPWHPEQWVAGVGPLVLAAALLIARRREAGYAVLSVTAIYGMVLASQRDDLPTCCGAPEAALFAGAVGAVTAVASLRLLAVPPGGR